MWTGSSSVFIFGAINWSFYFARRLTWAFGRSISWLRRSKRLPRGVFGVDWNFLVCVTGLRLAQEAQALAVNKVRRLRDTNTDSPFHSS